VAFSLVVAALIAAVAIHRGGLPKDAGAPPDRHDCAAGCGA